MKTDRMSDLRQRLRTGTRAAHEALDARLSDYDIATPEGLGRFLSLQRLALTALEPLSAGAAVAPLLRDMRDHAEADLLRLGWPAHDPVPEAFPGDQRPPHPLALDYVIAGSRLGTMVLRKRWAASRDPAVRDARAYFSAPDHTGYWTAFCKTAGAVDAETPLADRVVTDAARLFHFYQHCADAVLHPGPEVNA